MNGVIHKARALLRGAGALCSYSPTRWELEVIALRAANAEIAEKYRALLEDDCVPIKNATKDTGIPRTTLQRWIKSGEIVSIAVGRTRWPSIRSILRRAAHR
jgi:DNA invertase Pin-like site-specific DNA recombinase